MKIYSYDVPEENEILRKVSRPLKKEEIKSPKIQKLIKGMREFLKKQPDGAGLSAPQVGHNLRIFILNPNIFDYKIDTKDTVFINPKFISKSTETVTYEEGCFSVRWIYGPVERPKKIKLEYYNLEGKKKIIEAEDFLSAAIQHEYDHLDGILFIDKAKSYQRLSDEEIKKLKEEWIKMGYEEIF